MPRIPRGQLPEAVFHVLNRGNNRATVFRKDGDYRAFISLLAAAKSRAPIRLFAFTMLPNHFHAVVQPIAENAMSNCVQWWLTSHVRRYHRHYASSGHVWQGRFKSFPVQQDEHFLTVVRYVLQNPVRAQLAAHAGDWPWSSLHFPQMIDPWPVAPPTVLTEWLRLPVSPRDLDGLRNSVRRQAPFGSGEWQEVTAMSAGSESTLRSRGRPRKSRPQEGPAASPDEAFYQATALPVRYEK